MSKKEKPSHNMWQNTWFMIKTAWQAKEKKVVFLCVAVAVFAVLNNLINLYVSPTILSAVEKHASVTELLMTIGVFVFGLMFVSASAAYINVNTLFGRITVRLDVINKINKKAATTSYPNINDEHFNKLLAKCQEATGNNNTATEAIWNTLSGLLTNIAGFIIYVCLLTTVQPILIAIIIATTLISYFLSKRLSDYEFRHRDEIAEYESQMFYFNHNASDVNGGKDIRIFGLRPWLEELYKKAQNSYTAFHRKAQGIYIWGNVADIVLTFLRNGAAYAYLIGLVLEGNISVAEFLLFFSTVGGFTEWVTGILNGFNTLHIQSLSICNVRDFLDFPEPFTFKGGKSISPEKGKKYEIKLENVSFKYPTAQDYTLKSINLTLHPDEKLAIVGLNGAGKTTLVKLICGFLDPTEGRVTLNGIDIREFNRDEYYTMFSAVFQTFSLLAGTIGENVAQSQDKIDIRRVKDCTEKAGLNEKINSLPDGYETLLNREVYEQAVMLSGGETQKLMLARALYKDAPFVVLDEPTAALDPIAESEMYKKYGEMTDGKISVYISHRLASTRFCDRILMLDQGIIAEQGTHTELMQAGGKYAGLFEIQRKYYKEDESNGRKDKA